MNMHNFDTYKELEWFHINESLSYGLSDPTSGTLKLVIRAGNQYIHMGTPHGHTILDSLAIFEALTMIRSASEGS